VRYKPYPTYKDSGVEWLGEVPEHWDVRRLKHCLNLMTDKTSRRGHPVALENIEGWSGRFIETASEFEGEGVAFVPGDILFGKLRPYLAKAYLAQANGEAVGDFHVLRPEKSTAGRFAQYQILNRDFIAIADSSTFGAKMPRVGWEFMGNMAFLVPSPAEQTTIAAFLDHETATLDTLIAKQERLIELLQEKRQALISHAVTKGLNPDAPMKDSGVEWLGEVPAHWDVMAIKHVCTLLKDGTHLPPQRVDDGVPLLSVRNIQDGVFSLLDDDSMISHEDFLELCRSFVPQPNDVLLAIVGATLGKTAVVPPRLGQFHIQRSLAIFRPNHLEHFKFLHRVFESGSFQQLLWENVGFSAQPGIYLGALANFRIPVPPVDEQGRLINYLDYETFKLDCLIEKSCQCIALMRGHRTALVSSAVTGKIDVREFANIKAEESELQTT